jgi:hypothetical protein
LFAVLACVFVFRFVFDLVSHEGIEVFEYSAEESEIEKNNMPPNNTYTPPSLPTLAPALPPPPPPPIDPSERKIVAVEDNAKSLLDSLIPVDKNKLHQWLENKLESMSATIVGNNVGVGPSKPSIILWLYLLLVGFFHSTRYYKGQRIQSGSFFPPNIYIT